jgi:hypothetical protein
VQVSARAGWGKGRKGWTLHLQPSPNQALQANFEFLAHALLTLLQKSQEPLMLPKTIFLSETEKSSSL